MSHDYPNIARELLQSLGGSENLEQAAHCVTRLRLALKNPALVNVAALNGVDLVKGSFFTGGLYQVVIGPGDVEKVYAETHEKVFYDSMNFWNNDEGILIGDPISNCLSVVITRNGGKTWQKVPCENLPKTVESEAAFAASNTNVIIKGNHCWIVSGGVKSRVFYSSDKGKTWSVFETPIVQGQAMTGIFTADFYDEKIGFIAGGNYEIPTQNFQNKAITFDGGKTWDLVAENQGFGYASCVQFVPNSGGREIISVGATGLHYSSDFGKTWKQFSTDNSLYTLRFVSPNLAFAAGKDKIVRVVLDRKI